MNRRLSRCRENRVIAGVASGVAEFFGLDPTLVRVLWFLSIFFGGVSLLLYIGLVALRRGHAHVDDGHIRSVLLDRRDERLAVADLGQDRPAGLLDQPGDAFADERRVLGDDDTEGLLGHPKIMHRGPRLDLADDARQTGQVR